MENERSFQRFHEASNQSVNRHTDCFSQLWWRKWRSCPTQTAPFRAQVLVSYTQYVKRDNLNKVCSNRAFQNNRNRREIERHSHHTKRSEIHFRHVNSKWLRLNSQKSIQEVEKDYCEMYLVIFPWGLGERAQIKLILESDEVEEWSQEEYMLIQAPPEASDEYIVASVDFEGPRSRILGSELRRI